MFHEATKKPYLHISNVTLPKINCEYGAYHMVNATNKLYLLNSLGEKPPWQHIPFSRIENEERQDCKTREYMLLHYI